MIVVDGTEYESVEALSRVCGVDAPTLRYRISAGVPDFLLTRVKLPKIKAFYGETLEREALGVEEREWKQLRSRFTVAELQANLEECRTRMSPNAVCYEGVWYRDYIALGEDFGLTAAAARYRMQTGISLTGKGRVGRPTAVTWEGVEYGSYKELAEALEVDYRTLTAALRDGCSLQEAILKAKAYTPRVGLDYEGEHYDSRADLAGVHDVPVNRLKSRLARGMSLQDALTTPKKEKREIAGKPVTYNGKTYNSRTALCEDLGLNKNTINQRIADGWTLERAIETPVDNSREIKPVVIKGVEYASKQAAYDAYGIPKSAVRRRTRNGMSLEEAVTTPWSSKESYKWDGKEFTSLIALEEYLGCPQGVLRGYLSDGMSFKDACVAASNYEREETMSAEEVSAFGCSKAQVYAVRRRLGGDLVKTREWLTRVFLDSPTRFHKRVYTSVKDACEKLEIWDVASVQSRMLNLMDFEDAIHELYYVYSGRVYQRREDLRVALGISRPKFGEMSQLFVDKTNDEIVRISVTSVHTGTNTVESTSLSIKKSNKDVQGVVNCRNGMFVVYCSVCGRPLYLSEEEARVFQHDDTTCADKVHDTLYRESVTAEQFRESIRRKGSYEAAVAVYDKPLASSVPARIKQRQDVDDVRVFNKGKYALVKCAVCGVTSMQPLASAKVFEHSDKCEELKWEYMEPPYKHRIGTPPWWWSVME